MRHFSADVVPAGGSNAVTVTFNQEASYVDVRVLEYNGLDTSSTLDVTTGTAGSSKWSKRSEQRRPLRPMS